MTGPLREGWTELRELTRVREAPRDLQAQGASISQMTGGRMKADGVGPGGGRWGAVMAEPRRSKPGAGRGETPPLLPISPPVFPLALYNLTIQPVWVSLGAQKNAEEGGRGEGGLSLGNCDGREFTNRNETGRSGRA